MMFGLAAVVAATVCGFAAAGGHEAFAVEKRAVTLTAESFDDHLAKTRKEKRRCFVMFHVDWCKVCQRAFPEFATASEQVYDKGLSFDFAHVDCTSDKTLCNRFDVKGYPTLKLFSTEEGVDPRLFKLPRNAASFGKYAERMLQPPVRVFGDRQKFETAFSNESLASFIAASPEGKGVPKAMTEAAETWMDRHIFAAAERLEDLLPTDANPPRGASLAVLSTGVQQQWPGRNKDAKPIPAVAYFQGALDNASAISEWVEKNRFPGIWMLGESNFAEFTHASRTTVILAIDPANVTVEVEDMLRKATVELSDEFIFGAVDGVSWKEELKDFNIFTTELPRVLVTEENFEVWIEDVHQLRASSLVDDLRIGVLGSSLGKQSRTTLSKVYYYMREGSRYADRAQVHMKKGPVEASVVVIAVLSVACLILFVCWALFKVCGILLADPDDMDSYRQHQLMQAQAEAKKSR